MTWDHSHREHPGRPNRVNVGEFLGNKAFISIAHLFGARPIGVRSVSICNGIRVYFGFRLEVAKVPSKVAL